MARGGWVYIMASKSRGVIYIGVTADIDRRIWQHRNGKGSAFCRRYGPDRLVRGEEFETIDDAIAREKQLKNWKRDWKIELIEADNPGWHDLGTLWSQAASEPGMTTGSAGGWITLSPPRTPRRRARWGRRGP